MTSKRGERLLRSASSASGRRDGDEVEELWEGFTQFMVGKLQLPVHLRLMQADEDNSAPKTQEADPNARTSMPLKIAQDEASTAPEIQEADLNVPPSVPWRRVASCCRLKPRILRGADTVTRRMVQLQRSAEIPGFLTGTESHKELDAAAARELEASC